MIKSLEIENFKCFNQLRLEFGHLTLLTGFNSGGKSSAIQPLLLLGPSLRNRVDIKYFPLNGPLVHLGTVGEVLSEGKNGSGVTFVVASDVETTRWKTYSQAGDRFLTIVSSETRLSPGLPDQSIPELPKDGQGSVYYALSTLSYLSAVREGTSDAYPMPESSGEGMVDVGVDGGYASYWYEQFVDDEVPLERRLLSEEATSVRKQLDAWLSSLFPGAQANVQQFTQIALESLQFRLTGTGTWRRPANVGYGFTYAFPILVALLTAKKGQTIVIDSPEAHLHPSAQSKMGQLIAKFASAGIQIIVETHSDHLLNGVRLAVKDGFLRPESLRIHFFNGVGAEGHGVSTPAIDREGRLNSWPDGFFDQSEQDLGRLAGWEK